jgi:hypothetical protein
MASAEERARIMAEYMQSADRDVEDEEEFQDDEEDSNDEGSYDGQDDEGEESEPADENYAVLNGKILINEEGRIVFGGNWCMKKDLEKQGNKSEKEQRKTRFKMKSKQSLGKKGRFDPLLNPLMPNKMPRTVLFDGFFTTDDTDTVEPHRKMKERDIEIVFSQAVLPLKNDDAESNSEEKEAHPNGNGHRNGSAPPSFVIKGKGTNDFGNFTMEGIFCPNPRNRDGHPLTCSKRYSRSASKRSYDSEDDYEMSADEAAPADLNELCGLADDAQLSVEQLRQKYYGGSDDDNNGQDDVDSGSKVAAVSVGKNDGKPAAKRSKVVDDDEDDGCGF